MGGRAHAVRVPVEGEGQEYDMVETGGSIIIQANHYVRGFAEELGLELVPPTAEDSSPPFGVWNEGEAQLTLNANRWKLLFYGQLLWRYGSLKMWSMSSTVKSVLARWNRLYQLQDAGASFHTVEAFLHELGLFDMTQSSFDQYYAGSALGTSLLHDEIIHGVATTNYCQEPSSLHALVGMISLAPMNAGPVLAVKGGFQQIPEGLLQSAGAKVHTSHRVSGIVRDGSKFVLRDSRGKAFSDSKFDYVVIATPLENSSLALNQLRDLKLPPKRPYQLVHVTLVRGRLNPQRFGLTGESEIPSQIIIAKSSTKPFFKSISRWKTFQDGSSVYKIFSDAKLQAKQLQELFLEWEKPLLAEKQWKAYPTYRPPESFPEVELADNLFYINSIESAASAYEVVSVWARNVAFLIAEKAGVPKVEQADPAGRDEL